MSSDRLAVVGGGTGALGRTVVTRLVAEGWHAVIPDRHVDRATHEPAVTRVPCELDDPVSVSRFCAEVTKVGTWSALVNCSGGFASGAAHDTPDDLATSQLQRNLLGPWRLSRGAAGAMAAAGGGHIVNVVSMAALNVAPGQGAYQVSKAAMLRLSDVMARELAPLGVIVSAVLPSVMDTPANRREMPGADTSRWWTLDEVASEIHRLLTVDAAEVVRLPLKPPRE